MNGRTHELYLAGRVKDAALEAVKVSLLDGHMKCPLDGNVVASPTRGLDLTSGGSTHAQKDTSIPFTRHQIRTLAVYMHLSFAIIYSRSVITSASTTTTSFRYHINIISVTFAALHMRISLRFNHSHLKSRRGWYPYAFSACSACGADEH